MYSASGKIEKNGDFWRCTMEFVGKTESERVCGYRCIAMFSLENLRRKIRETCI